MRRRNTNPTAAWRRDKEKDLGDAVPEPLQGGTRPLDPGFPQNKVLRRIKKLAAPEFSGAAFYCLAFAEEL